MSVATSAAPSHTSQQAKLWSAGLVGAALVLGGLFAILALLPKLWATSVDPALGDKLAGISFGLRVIAQIACLVVLATVGARLLSTAAVGARGATFLAITFIFTAFFTARALYMIALRFMDGTWITGDILAMIWNAFIAFVLFRFATSDRMARWSVVLERGGWFTTTPYKRTQGQLIRRLTILGFLVIIGSAVYSLSHHGHLRRFAAPGTQDWVMRTPGLPDVTLLPDLQFTVPLILIAGGIWLALRAVNYPPFADFLIATEAEMNKVAWPTKRNLIKDTIVVLIMVALLAIFLFLVDVFWGWLLSRELIGILPTDQQKAQIKKPDQAGPNDKLEW